MSSIRQLEANRRNAQKSTGPKTPEGKSRVSRNALKHGLAGHGVVLTDEMTAAVEQRKRDWFADYRPDSPAQRWRFERLCIESVRLDVCFHQSVTLRDEHALRASESWDDDRAFEAELLGSRLSSRPELIQPELLQSRSGVLWLIDRWEGLLDAIDRQETPTEADWSLLLDLLGVPVDDRLDAPRRLLGESSPPEAVSDFIRDQLDELRLRLDSYLDDRDDRARVDAQAGLSEDTPAVARLGRYEGQLLRRLRQAETDLRRLQAGPPSPAEPPRSPSHPRVEPPREPQPSPSDPAPDPPERTPDADPRAHSEPSPPPAPLNRRQRRALKARARRASIGRTPAHPPRTAPDSPRSAPNGRSPGDQIEADPGKPNKPIPTQRGPSSSPG